MRSEPGRKVKERKTVIKYESAKAEWNRIIGSIK